MRVLFLGVVGHGKCLLTAWDPLSLLLESVFLLEPNEAHAACGFVDFESVGGCLMVDL